MTFVPFGAICSLFLLSVIIRHHLLDRMPSCPVAGRLFGNIYVDDVVVTGSSADDMRALHSEAVKLFSSCSMLLHKWRSSDPTLDREWALSDAPSEAKVLGMRWWPKEDVIASVAPTVDTTTITRRLLL